MIDALSIQRNMVFEPASIKLLSPRQHHIIVNGVLSSAFVFFAKGFAFECFLFSLHHVNSVSGMYRNVFLLFAAVKLILMI